MSVSKPLLFLYSFLLFFCLFSKQADYISNIYCDVADSADICQVLGAHDGTHLETDDQLDSNDPFVLPFFISGISAKLFIFSINPENRYIPPQLTRVLRPPLQ